MAEVVVRYDDRDTTRASTYFRCLDKYGAAGMGHADGTSSMFMEPENFDRKKLARDLGGIPIVAVRL